MQKNIFSPQLENFWLFYPQNHVTLLNSQMWEEATLKHSENSNLITIISINFKNILPWLSWWWNCVNNKCFFFREKYWKNFPDENWNEKKTKTRGLCFIKKIHYMISKIWFYFRILWLKNLFYNLKKSKLIIDF